MTAHREGCASVVKQNICETREEEILRDQGYKTRAGWDHKPAMDGEGNI
jgi:hypothetical protein